MPTKTIPLLLSVNCISDSALHSALTDLILWKNEFWCVFREADMHFGGQNGILKLLASPNGIVWRVAAHLNLDQWDLRDPKLSIKPDGNLMLIAGASLFSARKVRLAHQTVVSFSRDGIEWGPFETVLSEEWLWRVTWFKGRGYGISYYFLDFDNPYGEWGVRLYVTEDGFNYKPLSTFGITGQPNEATLRFLSNGEMVALLRRNGPENDHAWIGYSFPPYEDWLWSDAGMHLGGPNFLILPDGKMWAAGRVLSVTPYGLIEQTAIAEIKSNRLEPKLIVPSGGDCSYPGLVYADRLLWISYYSSHEEKTGIYLAKVDLG